MFINFRDLSGIGIIGCAVIGFFVLLGGLPVISLLCVGILTYLAMKYAR